MLSNMSYTELLALGNFVLNMLIVPIVIFAWRIAVAVVRMEQILIEHNRRISRVEDTLDTAAKQGRLERRVASR